MGASTASVTITAAAGAGESAVADVFAAIQDIKFDIIKEMIFIRLPDGRTVEYPFDAISTITWTISGNDSTVTIST